MPKTMFRLLAATLAGFAAANPLHAEALPYDHMHLAADDRDAAHDWYIEHLGAKLHPRGDRVLIGDVMIVFIERDGSPRSEGSAIDHFGISVPDLAATMSALEAAGVTVLAPMRDAPGLFPLAFIEDPWGTKIELVEDPETPGFHHVHVNVPDPAATYAWYAEHLGGEPASLKGRIDGLRFGDVWFLAREAADAPPSRGHAIDHLGWRIPDIDAMFAGLERAGVDIVVGPIEINGVRAGLVDDGDGVVIDLVQRN